MAWLRNLRTMVKTEGMPAAYGRWLLHRTIGLRGPTLDLGNGALVGAKWRCFSEYWSFRCGEFNSGPTNALGSDLGRFLERCAASAPNGIAVDAGANVGIFSVKLAALGYRVHSFEPIHETLDRLLENLALNPGLSGRVHVNEKALSDREGVVTMTAPGRSPATAHIASEPGNGTSVLLSVAAVALDDYAAFRGWERIDFLKLDVEGYEPAVLRGATKLLKRRAIGTILFEWGPPMLRRAGFDPRELLDELSAAGYALYRIGTGGQLRRIDATGLLAEGIEWDNLVAEPTDLEKVN